MCIAIDFLPDCDVISWEIILMAKTSTQNFEYLENGERF